MCFGNFVKCVYCTHAFWYTYFYFFPGLAPMLEKMGGVRESVRQTYETGVSRLKPESHCGDNQNDNDHDAKQTHFICWMSVRILCVDRSNSTNRMHSLCVVIVIIFVAAADLVSLVSNAVLFSFQTPHHLNMLNNHQPLRQKYNLATVFNQVMSSCMICSSWLTFTINWSSDSSSTLTLTEPALMGFNGIIMRVIALNQSIFNPVVFNQ